MKSLSDAWHLHQEKLGREHLDARARAEVERAFYAGAENILEGVQDLNDAGLSLPFTLVRQVTAWESEVAAQYRRREGDA